MRPLRMDSSYDPTKDPNGRSEVELAKPESRRAWREEKEGDGSCQLSETRRLNVADPTGCGRSCESAVGESCNEDCDGSGRENRLFRVDVEMSIGSVDVGDGLLSALSLSGLDECTNGDVGIFKTKLENEGALCRVRAW